jgi:2-hydroxy-3-keto-5-methylthiopentenyl-1-phosphate phosphatase
MHFRYVSGERSPLLYYHVNYLPVICSEASREQLESIKIGFDKCVKKAMGHIQLDKHFLDFYNWATSVSMPIVVLSGGFIPLIEAALEQFTEHELHGIEVVANSVAVRDGFKSINEHGGAWRVQFRDNSIYGNDKAQAIKPYAEHRETMDEADKPILLFAGDGISDLGAAGHTDLLFAKQGEGIKLNRHHEH